MSIDRGSPSPSPEFPVVVRPETRPARPTPSLLPVRRQPEITLSRVVIASGIALTVEGLRWAMRAGLKRAEAKRLAAEPPQITVAYEWTLVTYERYERS